MLVSLSKLSDYPLPMSTSGSNKPAKHSNPRKRIKVQCTECGLQFDDDYKSRHEKKVHAGKHFRIQHVGAPANPFEAASCSKKKKLEKSKDTSDPLDMESSTSELVSCTSITNITDTPQFSSTSLLQSELQKSPTSQFPTENLTSTREPEIQIVQESSALIDEPSNTDSPVLPLFMPEEQSTNRDELPDSWLCSIGQVSEFLANFKSVKNILKKFKNEELPNPKIFLAEMTDCFSKIVDESQILLKSLIEVQSKLSFDEPVNLEITKDELVLHDPGSRKKITSFNEQKYLSALGPFHPKIDSYSINSGIFCFACSLFPEGPGRSYSCSEWVTVGLHQWHKMKSRGKNKKGKLAEHFASESHKAALSDYCHLIRKGDHILSLIHI